MVYSIKSVDYLIRARSLLDSSDKAALFYAAFELRCGIEARLKEYFDAQAETTKKKRNGWKIDKLAKQVEAVFNLCDRGLRLVVFDAETNALVATLLYTPVTSQLTHHVRRALCGPGPDQHGRRRQTHPHPQRRHRRHQPGGRPRCGPGWTSAPRGR